MELKPGYKQTEVGVLPEDWDVKRLGEIGKVVRGGSPRPAGDPKFFGGDFIPWLTVAALTNIPDHQLDIRHTETRLTEEGSKRSRTLQAGTVIIANSGATLGIAKVSTIECCANDGVAAIIDQHAGEKAFVCHCINSQTQRLREVVATGNGQPNLNTGLIKQIAIPWPPHTEQAAIAECISDFDKLLLCLEEAVVKKQRLKQAAMQELLTGKRRLPWFEGEWEARILGGLGDFLKGSGVKKDEAASGDLPCVRYGEIYTHHENYVSEFRSHISEAVSSMATAIHQGDILFAGSGETKEEIGKAVALPHPVKAFAGGDIVILRQSANDTLFLGYRLNANDVSRQKASLGQGDAVVHISAHALSKISVSLPSRAEQEAIAGILYEMDIELRRLQLRLVKMQSLKQGMLQQLLTGKIRLI
jgi:type I restriction enzyme S subunit